MKFAGADIFVPIARMLGSCVKSEAQATDDSAVIVLIYANCRVKPALIFLNFNMPSDD